MEVLRTKHPDIRPPSVASLDTYLDRPSETILVEITKDTVTEVVGKLSGGEGPGGTYLVSFQHLLLRFREASVELQLTVADLTESLGNG